MIYATNENSCQMFIHSDSSFHTGAYGIQKAAWDTAFTEKIEEVNIQRDIDENVSRDINENCKN